MKNSRKLTYCIIAAMLAALTCVFTMFLKIPIMGGNGYIHLGDMVIYLAASLLPLPYAMASAAIGGTLADILGGAAVWAPATFIIKALLTLCFTRKGKTIISVRNAVACVLCAVITVGGYYIAEGIIYGNWIAAVASIPWNVAQAVGSALLYAALSFALDRMHLKNRLFTD